MNNIIKQIILISVAIILSYFTSDYFGNFYSFLFGSGSSWIGSESSWDFIIGLPLSLIFFLTLISYIWVFKSKSSTLWLISPLLLWEGTVDIRHIYIPILLVIVAFGLATLFKKLFKRNSAQKLN